MRAVLIASILLSCVCLSALSLRGASAVTMGSEAARLGVPRDDAGVTAPPRGRKARDTIDLR